jgi:hypothetical protein
LKDYDEDLIEQSRNASLFMRLKQNILTPSNLTRMYSHGIDTERGANDTESDGKFYGHYPGLA